MNRIAYAIKVKKSEEKFKRFWKFGWIESSIFLIMHPETLYERTLFYTAKYKRRKTIDILHLKIQKSFSKN
jgi:hypothetical protein